MADSSRLVPNLRSMARRTAFVVAAVLVVAGVPRPAAAHGIGGRSDLPLELSFFLVGAGVVLVVSFVALAVLWPAPRLQTAPTPRPTRLTVRGRLRRLVSWLGFGVFALVLVAGLAGRDNGSENIVPVLIWVVAWLVVPFAAVVVGNVWADLDPWRSMTRVFRFGDETPAVLERLGLYPASLALLAFVWLELIYPDNGSPRALAVAALAYTFYVLAFVSWAGPETGLRTSELFTTYNRLLSAIAPFGRDETGRLVWRGWLRALPVLQHLRGTTVFVLLMLGTVTFDGLSGTPWWNSTVASIGLDPRTMLVATIGLLVVCQVVAAGYLAASWAAARLAGGDHTMRSVARRFAHTLIPIAAAYAIAHYFTLIVFEGQLLFRHASDPLGLGWDLFGSADWVIQFWLSPTAVWYVQLIAIVAGHVAGVVLAHDRALADFSANVAVRSQYAMLVLMVLLTGLGLTILAVG